MSTEEATTIAARPPSAAQVYGRQVETLATRELERVLGSEEGKRAAARVALAFRATGIANPTVYECDPGSVAACVATSAMTSLMPGGPNPDCYLVPRRVKGSQQLNWMISHRGLIKLATRAGYTIKARAVYKDEVFEYEEGETIHIKHVPNLDRVDAKWEDMRGVIVRCYRISDGKQVGVEYVNRGQIEKRRNQSDAYQRGAKPGADEWSRSSPWFKWAEEMSLKTAVKYAFSRGGIPIDDVLVREAISRDAEDAIETTATVVQPESSTRAIAQRDRFDEAIGGVEPVRADIAEDALRAAIGDALKSKRWTNDQVAILLRGGKAADVPEEDRGNVMDALAAGPDDPKVAEFLADAAAEMEAKRQAAGGGQ